MADREIERLHDLLKQALAAKVAAFPDEPTKQDFVPLLASLRAMKPMASALAEDSIDDATREAHLESISNLIRELAR